MLVTTIGSSSGCSTSLRDSAGVYVQCSKNILLDVGESTNKFFLNRHVDEIDVVCITHAHIDHFIGLPMLLFHNLTIRNRTKPLHIIMPHSVYPFIEPYINDYHLSMNFECTLTMFDEYTAPKRWNFGDVIINAYEMKHSIPSCFGYEIIDYDCGRSVLYTGDTEPFKSLPMICDFTDLVIIDGTWASDYTGPRYGHSWVKEIIEAVDQAYTTKLVLTHLSQRYHSESGYRAYSTDVASAFADCKNLKRIYIAYDGLTIQI